MSKLSTWGKFWGACVVGTILVIFIVLLLHIVWDVFDNNVRDLSLSLFVPLFINQLAWFFYVRNSLSTEVGQYTTPLLQQ